MRELRILSLSSMGREFATPVERSLAQLGNDVFCLYPSEQSTFSKDGSLEKFPFRANILERALGAVFGSSTVAAELIRGAKLILRNRVEVIQAYFAYPPGLAAAVLKMIFPSTRLVITVSGVDVALLDYKGRYGLRWGRKKRAMISFALRIADSVIAPSAFGSKLAVESGARPSDVEIVPWPFDILGESPGEMVNTEPDCSGRPTVLAASRHVPFKGLDFLIKAIGIVRNSIPSVELILTGKPTAYTQELKELVFSLGLTENVRFVGFLSREGLRKQLDEVNVFCQPGLADLFAVSALEAMACGKPIVVTRLVGIESFVTKEEAGIVVPPFDPSGLAEALVELLSNGGLRERMGENAHRLSLSFTPRKVAQMYARVYHELASKHS